MNFPFTLKKHPMDGLIATVMGLFLGGILLVRPTSFSDWWVQALIGLGAAERLATGLYNLFGPSVVLRKDKVTSVTWWGIKRHSYPYRHLGEIKLAEGQLFITRDGKALKVSETGRWGLRPSDINKLEKELNHVRRNKIAEQARVKIGNSPPSAGEEPLYPSGL